MLFFLPLLVVLLLAGMARWRIQSATEKYRHQPLAFRMSGWRAAEQFLKDHGVTGVRVVEHQGMITNLFDERNRELRLSRNVYQGDGVWAVTLACQQAAMAVFWSEKLAVFPARTRAVRLSRFFSGATLVVALGLLVMKRLTGASAIFVVGAVWFLLAMSDFATKEVEDKAGRLALIWLRKQKLFRHIDDEIAAETVAAAASWSSLTNFLNAIPMFFYQFLPMFGGKKRL